MSQKFHHTSWLLLLLLLLGSKPITIAQTLLQRNYSGLPDGAQQTLHSEASRLTDLVNAYFRTTGFQVLDVGLYDLSINMQGEQSFDVAFQTADAEVQGQAIPAARQAILRGKLNLNAYLLMVWQVAADGRSLKLRWKLRLPDNGTLPPTELLELEGILTSMGSQVAEQQMASLGLGKWAEAAGAGVKKIADLLERKMRGEEVLAGEVYLSRIAFKNFHPVEFNNKPEWKYQSDSLSSSSPLCYVGGTNMQMFPEIKCPQNKVISNTIRVKIKYDGIESLPFEAVYHANSGLVTASAADGVWLSLEQKISFRNLLNIDWFLKIGETSDWFFIGTSKHQIFVILNKPPTNIQARIEHLYFTCSQADGVSSEKEMVDIIWNAFKERSLHLQMFRPDQEAIPFTYYLTPNKGCSRGIIDSLPTLVNGKKIIDGECGAFADLLSRLLLVQGIKHYMIVVAPKNDKGFLIQNWAFSKQTTIGNYPYLNIFESADGDPRSEGNSYKKWKAGSPLAFYDLPGIKGQNVENPYSDFEDHYFIKVGTEYFDPSYGTRHTKIEDWVAASIAGFTDEIRLRANTTNLYDFKARKSSSPIMDLDITESIRE